MTKYFYHPDDLKYMRQNNLKYIHDYQNKIQLVNALRCCSFVDGVKAAYDKGRSVNVARKLLRMSRDAYIKHARLLGMDVSYKYSGRKRKSYSYKPEDAPFKPIHFYYDLLKISEGINYPSVKSAVIGEYVKTGSIRKVAEILDISHQAVRNMLIKFGVGLTRRGRKPIRAKTYLSKCIHHGKTEFYQSCRVCCKCQKLKNERALKKESKIILCSGYNKTGGQNV